MSISVKPSEMQVRNKYHMKSPKTNLLASVITELANCAPLNQAQTHTQPPTQYSVLTHSSRSQKAATILSIANSIMVGAGLYQNPSPWLASAIGIFAPEKLSVPQIV
jgi:hypothetical protein